MRIDFSKIAGRTAKAFAHLFYGAKNRLGPRRRATLVKAVPKRPTALSAQRHRTNEDDPREEMGGLSETAVARRRERARCEAILSCAAAQKRPALAKGLAFESRMTRRTAIAFLEASPEEAAKWDTRHYAAIRR